ncbi:hypothetical protein TNCV_2818311 [Trichonephila clavipes]|nr:hypothetical protein TNCV_2818311 [Trichonephila clavipes]
MLDSAIRKIYEVKRKGSQTFDQRSFSLLNLSFEIQCLEKYFSVVGLKHKDYIDVHSSHVVLVWMFKDWDENPCIVYVSSPQPLGDGTVPVCGTNRTELPKKH